MHDNHIDLIAHRALLFMLTIKWNSVERTAGSLSHYLPQDHFDLGRSLSECHIVSATLLKVTLNTTKKKKNTILKSTNTMQYFCRCDVTEVNANTFCTKKHFHSRGGLIKANLLIYTHSEVANSTAVSWLHGVTVSVKF